MHICESTSKTCNIAPHWIQCCLKNCLARHGTPNWFLHNNVALLNRRTSLRATMEKKQKDFEFISEHNNMYVFFEFLENWLRPFLYPSNWWTTLRKNIKHYHRLTKNRKFIFQFTFSQGPRYRTLTSLIFHTTHLWRSLPLIRAECPTGTNTSDYSPSSAIYMTSGPPPLPLSILQDINLPLEESLCTPLRISMSHFRECQYKGPFPFFCYLRRSCR